MDVMGTGALRILVAPETPVITTPWFSTIRVERAKSFCVSALISMCSTNVL